MSVEWQLPWHEGPVHWEEGLFLQPHHLQRMQKHLLDGLAHERSFAWEYPYGVLDMKVVTNELSRSHVVRVEELRAIMPNGLEVWVPYNTAPLAADLKKALTVNQDVLMVNLAVPRWHDGPPGNTAPGEAAEAGSTEALFRTQVVEVCDENTGKSRQPLAFRRVNARLVPEYEDCSHLEVMPLLRISRTVGKNGVELQHDPTYDPPCLLLRGSPLLRECMDTVTAQVAKKRDEVVGQITRGGFNPNAPRGEQLRLLLLLRILNSFDALLGPLQKTSWHVSPFRMYLLLRQLLAELAALRPDRGPFKDLAEYNHHEPAPVFRRLRQDISKLLPGIEAPEPNFFELPFDWNPNHTYQHATLREEHFSRGHEFYLAVRTKGDRDQLQQLVKQRYTFVLASSTLVSRLTTDQGLGGLKLEYERNPGPGLDLPDDPTLHYFRVVRSELPHLWNQIVEEKSIGAQWPGMETSDYKLTLYVTILPTGG